MDIGSMLAQIGLNRPFGGSFQGIPGLSSFDTILEGLTVTEDLSGVEEDLSPRFGLNDYSVPARFAMPDAFFNGSLFGSKDDDDRTGDLLGFSTDALAPSLNPAAIRALMDVQGPDRLGGIAEFIEDAKASVDRDGELGAEDRARLARVEKQLLDLRMMNLFSL
jgi:hypothetical protein